MVPAVPPGDIDRREVRNAVLYQARTGCQWRLLPGRVQEMEHDLRKYGLVGETGVYGKR